MKNKSIIAIVTLISIIVILNTTILGIILPKTNEVSGGIQLQPFYMPQRPEFHFTAKSNWINDPNGPLYFNGKRHLYYQLNPGNTLKWGNISWGHTVSTDFFHWEDLPIALDPAWDSKTASDREGCWSGSAIQNPTTKEFSLFYTGVSHQWAYPFGEAQCAGNISSDFLSVNKWTTNPVIGTQPLDNIIAFRDPYLWSEEVVQKSNQEKIFKTKIRNNSEKKEKEAKEGKEAKDYQYWMAIGSGINGTKNGQAKPTATVLLYKATEINNYQTFEYYGQLVSAPEGIEDEIWECPDLILLNEQESIYMLSVSALPQRKPRYFVGKLNKTEMTFEIQSQQYYVDAGIYYASKHYYDEAKGTPIMYGWNNEEKKNLDPLHFAGVIGTPREIFPIINNETGEVNVGMKVVSEIESIRSKEYPIEKTITLNNDDFIFSQIQSEQLQFNMKVDLFENTDLIEISVLCNLPSREECTRILFLNKSSTIQVVRNKSSLYQDTNTDSIELGIDFINNENLKFVIIIDHSLLEIFINDRFAISTRVYPKFWKSRGVAIRAKGKAIFSNIQAYEIKSTMKRD